MNNNKLHQSDNTTFFHTHSLPPLVLQAVGGAIRLGRRTIGVFDALEDMKHTFDGLQIQVSETPGFRKVVTPVFSTPGGLRT
jgi:hypothetical protein